MWFDTLLSISCAICNNLLVLDISSNSEINDCVSAYIWPLSNNDERYNELKSFTELPKSNLYVGAYFGNDALSGNVISEGYYGG